ADTPARRSPPPRTRLARRTPSAHCPSRSVAGCSAWPSRGAACSALPACRLRPTNLASLIGRDEDLVRLITCVHHKRLVLVDSASGCGKPALVSAGRVPSLRQSDSPLPIAIRDWGDDWARGPLSAAVEGLFHGVSQTDRDRLGWTSSPIQGVP